MSEPEETFDDGWDMTAILVDGRWVHRSPRRPEIEPQARREAALMPWLAPRLPLPVPVPVVVSDAPLVLRHELLPGGPCPGESAAHGAVVGRFLAALHGLDPDEAVRHGVRDATASYAEAQAIRDLMATEVLPLLPTRLRGAGTALLDRMRVPPPEPRLVHGDLGPTHIRVVDDLVTGVIDWGDSGVGDPAIDLAWSMLGSARAFSEALAAAYRPDDELVARARDWHLLGPWHEVLYGLGDGGPAFVDSGLAGTIARLESAGRHTNPTS